MKVKGIKALGSQQFFGHGNYFDDSNAISLGDAKTDQKCQHWFHVF